MQGRGRRGKSTLPTSKGCKKKIFGQTIELDCLESFPIIIFIEFLIRSAIAFTSHKIATATQDQDVEGTHVAAAR